MSRRQQTSLRTPDDLVAAGLVPAAAIAGLQRVAERYAISLTEDVVALIDPRDAADPIARQYVPSVEELNITLQENADPIGDEAHSPVKGIVHRYPDRVLFKLVNVCAVYCRFCFRRETVGPGKETALSADAYAAAMDYIRGHREIWEVILTGGDPLMLSPRRLAEIMSDLAAVPHVKIIRLHTRVPVAAPDRVTDEMTDALKVAGATTWIALHANHPRELTEKARDACARLIDRGLPMVSQSVLLRGVNDDIRTLEALMRTFVECRIKPYYLHHGDMAPGTSHLRTTIADGQALMRGLRGKISGLCQPEYVLDIPGGHGKSPIGPDYLSRYREAHGEMRYRILDYCGETHVYPPSGGTTETGDRSWRNIEGGRRCQSQ